MNSPSSPWVRVTMMVSADGMATSTAWKRSRAVTQSSITRRDSRGRTASWNRTFTSSPSASPSPRAAMARSVVSFRVEPPSMIFVTFRNPAFATIFSMSGT